MFVKTLLICSVIAIVSRSTSAQRERYEKLVCMKDAPCKCNETNSIWTIDCSKSRLTTTRILPNLNNSETIPFKEITFEDNLLTKLVRDDVNSLHPSHVEMLNFASNRISEIEDHAFDEIKFLKVLILSNNKLTTVNREWFDGLTTSLQHLDLTVNRITSIPNNSFDMLTDLKYLNLDNNPLTTIGDASFDGLSMLRYLSLDTNQLTSVDGAEFARLTRLETISIQHTNIEHLPVFKASMVSLTRVMLNENLVKAVHTNTFANVPTVEHISLDRMSRLNTIEKCAFCGLPNLKFLLISDSPKVTSIDEEAFDAGFGFTTPMATLDFSNNSLTTLSSMLIHWKSAGSIYLTGNLWNCTCGILWMADPNANVVDVPKCTYPSSFQNQPIKEIGQQLLAKCSRKVSYATPKLFIAMTIILLIFGTALVSWYVWSSRRGDGRLSNPFKRTSTQKPPYAYKNLAMSPDEIEQAAVANNKRQDQEEDEDAPYPPFDRQVTAKANLV